MNRTLQLIASVLFLSIQVMGQSLPCFNFEDIPANTQLGPASGNSPGDVLFSQAGVAVSIREIQYSNGDTGFGNAVVMDANVGWLDGQFFFMGNNSLLFDFSQADGALNQLCFDFFDGGGEENIAVNGSPVAVLENFSDAAGLSFPGVTIEVDFTNTSALGRGTVCISGNIESLLVGGQEFGIDNVCADAVFACPIDNLRAEITGCDNAGNYDVLVDFDWLSPLTVITSFDIFVEGGLVATVSQTELPYLLEGVQVPTDALEFILTVCQNDNPNCCASIVVPKQCPQRSCMEFEGLSEPVYGSSAGTPPGVAFYNESNIGLLLIPYQSLFWTTTYGDLIVLDAASAPEMSAASGKHLKFESVNAVFDLTGYSEPVDSVVVDFYYNGGAINLAANGSNILIQNALMPGLYALAPGITLRVVFDSSSDREGRLIFYGNVQSLLIGGAGDFRIDNLCVNPDPEPCRMGNMAIELGPCTADGAFLATIDFDYQGTSDSFHLSGPGVDGNYAYTGLPVTVGPVPSNNSGIYAFFAADLARDGCWVGDTIQAVPCTGCAFEGLTVDYLGLSPDGQNVISLDLNLVRPTLTDFFSVYFNGELYERFSWNDVPVRLQVPCNTTDMIQEITVCEGENHCCVSLPLIYLEPCSGSCSISNVRVDPGPCNPNNVFEVKLDLDYRNTSDTFELWLNGNATGRFFAYADLPLAIGPFVAPTNALEFKAVDKDNPDCSGAVTLPAYNCGNPCNNLIDSVAYYLTDCNDDGKYAIVIEQLFPNPPNLDFLFYVSVDGVLVGSYSSGSLPIDLGPFPGNGASHEVAVYTLPTAPCGYRFTTPPVFCNDGCPLQSVHLIGDVQCSDSGFYRAKLAVEGAAAGDVLTVTSTITNFSTTGVYTGDGFIIVEMPNTGQFFDNLKVCLPLSTTNVLCCVEVAFDFACHPCEIFDVHLQPLDCNADGQFFFVVDFEAAGNFGNTFFLMAGDGYNASFQYSDLPVTLGPLPGNGLPVSVWINDESQFCQVDLEMQAPNCSPCPWLAGINITPNDCRDDGTFTAMLNIVTPAPAIGSIFVVESGDYIGEFTVADLPVEIGPFPGTGAPRTVHVFFPGTDCRATATFITPNCGNGGCIFSSVIAEPYACDGGQFMVDVEVRVNNPGNLGYYIFADGQIFGPYSYNELFVTIGPFAGDGMEEYGILILDIADPSCFGFTEVGPIDCNDGCEIFDVVVDPLDCNPDGTYNLFLDFEVVHPGNDFFEVFGPNGGLIGYYRLDERPVIIEGLPLTSSGEGRLKVCINDHPDCCREVAYQQPNCGGHCSISDVHAEFAYCDADGNYFVRLSFNFENTDSPGFRVFGNGQDYGTYSYTMPFPVIVGPIAPTGALAYELIVADLGNPDCRSFTTFGAFDCDGDTEICITFDEFETAPNDTINLAFGQPRDSIYDEDGVVFNAVPIRLANSTNYFEWVVGSAIATCGPDMVDGNLYMNGGIEMHFGHLPSIPTTISFDITYCYSPNTVPEIVIGVNGEVFSGLLPNLPSQLGGISLEFIPAVNSGMQGQLILRGPVEHLLIGGRWLAIDNLCFNQPSPVDDDCLSFDVYDGAPSDTLANYGHPEEMEYVEDGVIVTARAIEWNGAVNYFTGVYAFEDDNCGFGDDDAALSFGGALRFNFAPLPDLPTEVTFNLAFCQGQARNIHFVVNGAQYRGSITDLPDMLANVGIMAMSNTLSGNIWRIKLTGTVEAFVIGGSALTIDDVCFHAPQEEEEVWPGDANADNIAHHIDLLNIGLAYGYQGTPRFEDGASWLAFSAGNWPQSFADGTNYKHADCNGDGVVDENDRQVLAQNYGLTHGPLSAPPFLPGTDTDPPVYVDFPTLVPVGTSFNIPIVVGTSRLPMHDVYGIAFTVVFDPVVFPPSNLEILYPVSWFGEPGVNTLSIDRTYAAEGRIEIAITRTDQNNVSGYGPVAHLIGIIDDIAGLKPATEVSIENIRAISVEEGQIPVQGRAVNVELQHKEEEPKADAKGVFSVFPNPTTDWVTVTSKFGYQPEQLSLLTLDGREVKAPQEENRRVSLAGLPAGTYILSIRTGDTRVHKLIVKD